MDNLTKKALESSIVIVSCLIICYLLYINNIEANLYFMGIGALVTIANTKNSGLRQGIERIIGCVSGALCSLVVLMLYQKVANIIFLVVLVGLIVFLLVYTNGLIKNSSGTLEATIVFTTLLVNAANHSNLVSYTCLRIIDTIIGFMIGVVINKLVFKNY